MKEQAKVVVIGGGVVGVSALYHLAKKGWGDDVVLLEKAELTSGSTWHAAGLLPLFNMSYSVGQVHKYSVNLYNQLEEETGQPVGFSRVGNLRLAMNDDRMDEYYQYAATARTIGVDVRFLTPAEIGNLWPLCNTDGLVGGIFHPEDGYIQPADLTQALAKGARARGANIYRNTAVLNIEQASSGGWVVETEKGSITCDHVISATGNYARKTGAMVGLDIPVIPVEHQYLVTEPHPALQQPRRYSSASRTACRSWVCCVSRTVPGTCARRTTASYSAPMRRAPRPVTWTAPIRAPNTSCSRRTSSGSSRTSRQR
jgi:dimethylglycine dehydrogenase